MLTEVDQRLLNKCLAREAGGWQDFVDRFIGLFTHVIHHTADARSLQLSAEQLEDVLGEVFLAIIDRDFAALRSFRQSSSLATYLTIVARRVAVREIVRLKRETSSSLASAPASTAGSPAGRERQELERLLSALSPVEANVCRLYHVEGKSYREIGQQLGIPEVAVAAALSRATLALRRERALATVSPGKEANSPVKPTAFRGSRSDRDSTSGRPPPDRVEVSTPRDKSDAFEDLKFTHFYPASASGPSKIPLYVYVHTDRQRDEVARDFESRRSFAAAARSDTGSASQRFPRGVVFTIVPFVANARISPRSVEIEWDGAFEHVLFAIEPREAVAEVENLTGHVRIFAGPLAVCELPIHIIAGGEPGAAETASRTLSMFRRLFVSYSRADLAVVKAVDALYQRSRPLIESLIDYKFLTGGDVWWDRIQEKIIAADAVQLFWSRHSAASEQVGNEWRFALCLPRTILPVAIETPWPEIPEELQHIHFEQFDRFLARLSEPK